MTFNGLNRLNAPATALLLCLILVCGSGCSDTGLSSGSFVRFLSSTGLFVPDNVVMISIDTLQAKRLGCYGFPSGYSATIDRIASIGTVRKTVYTVIPHTTPGHASLLTGLYPVNHGSRDNVMPIRSDLPTVAEIFQSNDYSTAGSVGHFLLSPSSSSLNRGFDQYWSPEEPRIQPGLSADGVKVFPLVSNTFRPWRTVNRHARAWMSDTVDPWFLFLHYYECHVPYEPAYPWSHVQGLHPYDAEIAGIDRAVLDVLRMLVENEFLNSTELVITADHGESLGEHDYWGHGENLHNPSMAIPWISMGSSLDEPRIVTGLNRIMDIGPEVLSTRDMVIPDQMDCGMNSDNSDVIFGESPSLFADEPQRRIRCVRDSDYSLIYHRNANITELYDLQNDPGETRNIADQYPNLAAEYTEKIDTFIENDTQQLLHPEEVLRPEVKEALRALGYIGI